MEKVERGPVDNGEKLRQELLANPPECNGCKIPMRLSDQRHRSALILTFACSQCGTRKVADILPLSGKVEWGWW